MMKEKNDEVDYDKLEEEAEWLIRLEEKIDRHPIIRWYYCNVMLDVLIKPLTPSRLKWVIFYHIAIIVFAVAFIWLMYYLLTTPTLDVPPPNWDEEM